MNEEEAIAGFYDSKGCNEIMRHQSDMNRHVELEEYNLFQFLKPKLFIDGDQWCVLYGKNLQEGIAGFGDSPHDAIWNFNKQWNKKLKTKD